jgi:hypothetical protein
MVVSSAGFGPELDCSGKAQKQLYEQITDTSSHQRGRPTSRIPHLSERKKSLVMGFRWEIDTKIDWPTDRRSQYTSTLNLTR